MASLLGRLKQILNRDNVEKIEDIEKFLLENNFGLKFSDQFVSEIREKHVKNIQQYLEDRIKEILDSKESLLHLKNTPAVILFVGTNGSGKTTSIAKIANIFKKRGKKVMFIAGDTFRAAAAEQLTKWANLINVPIVKQKIGSDPASVVFDGIESAISRKMDIVLVDSAGRVETKKNLLNELSKIERIIEKKIGSKPDETFLVMDAYTGQNGLSQIEMFSKVVKLTGIILTKLDGSSSGGIVVPIIQKYGIPVKFIGTGEDIDNISFFDANEYMRLLM